MTKIKLNILLVEDNPADVLFLREALAEDALADFDLTVAESLTTALNVLQEQTFHAALLDLGLPDSNGLDTFLKLHRSAPELPVVVLSALDDEEIAMQSMQTGAQDYLVKRPQDFPMAGRTIRYAIERNRVEKKLRESEQFLKEAQRIATMGSWRLDIPSFDLEWSENCYHLYGFEPGEIQPTFDLFKQMVHPDDLQLVEEASNSLLQNPKPFEYEYRIFDKNGHMKWLYNNIKPRMVGGRAVQFIGIQIDITERKQAQEKLQILTNLLSDGQRIAHMGSFEYDATTKRTIWSEEEYRIYGYDPSQPSPDYETMLAHSIHPEDANLLDQTFLAAMQNGTIYELEHRIVQPNGSVRWVYDRAHPYFDEHGQLLRYIGITQDITERKQAEETLRLQSAALNATANEIIITDVQGTILWVNPAWCKVTGYSPEEALGKNPRIVKSGKHDQTFYKEMWDQILTGETWHGEMFNKRKDGTLYQEDVTISPVRDTQGHITHFVGIKQDITERKRAEEKLRESEERLELVMEGSQLGYWDWDIETGKVHRNARWAEMLGYTLEEVEFSVKQWTDLQHHDDQEAAMMSIQDHLDGKTPAHRIEYRMRTKDGSYKWILDQARVVKRDANGKPLRMSGTHTDITDRKQAEEILRSSEEKLRSLVESETHFVIRIDMHGHYTYWNEKYKNEFGWLHSQTNFADANLMDSICVHHHQRAREAVEQCVSQPGHVIQIELDKPARDGSIRSTLWEWVCLTDENGQPSELQCMGIEITESKKAEKEIRLANDRFTQIANNVHEVFWMFELKEQRLVYISPAYENIWGRSVQTLYDDHRSYIKNTFPEDLPLVLKTEEMQIQGKPTDAEFRIIHSSGEIRWIHESAFPVFDETGNLVRTIGIAANITERKRAEEALNQRLEDLALINELNNAVNRGHDIVQLTEWLASETRKIFGSQHTSVYLINPDTQTLVMQHFTMPREPIEKLEKLIGRSLPQIDLPIGGDDHFSQVLNSDYGLLFTGSDEINQWLTDFTNTTFLPAIARPLIRKLIPAATTLLNIQSVISIPLKAGDEVLGLIEFATEATFEEDALERLQNIRHQLAEAILRKRTEQSLRESEEKYRLLSEELEKRVKQRTVEVQDLYDNAPSGYHSLDAQGNFIQVNQTQLNWSGYTREEMLGRSFREFVVVEDRIVFDREFRSLKERGYIRDVEFEMVRKDGSTYPILVNATAIYDADGTFVMSRSTVFDNTERKKSQDAMRQSEETYRSLFESANDAIFLLDISTQNYVRVNSRCPELLGVASTEELLGRNALDFIDPSEANSAGDRFNALLNGERILPYERTFRRADGSRVQTEINLSLIRDEQGQPKLIQSVVRDISLRKQAEEALRSSRDKLRVANESLEKAARMKDEFLASMSHELRTPLTGILGLSEALQYNTYGTLTEKQEKVIRAIEESGRHLLDLINDILDLSKIEAGMLELDIIPVSLAEICQASLQLTKGMAQKKRQTVRFSMEPATIHVRGDGRRLKQMLVNLLSNAIKFSPENGSLGLEVQADEKEKVVRLTVWDQGIGIAAENMDKLFQPFVQLESSLSRQYEGTGLGLSLVQRMADLHGGSVEVESALGKGSRFTILLPWAPDITLPHIYKTKGNEVFKKALIIEDREIDAEQLKRYLRILGMEVIIHPLGQNAMEKAEQEKPDMILLDLHLADRSGFDVLAELKANPNTLNIPVVFCSVEEKRTQAISLGAAAYLIKPVSLPELRDQIEKMAATLQQDSHAESKSVSAKPMVMIVDDNEVVIETLSDFLSSQSFQVASARSGMELFEKVADLHPDLILMDIQMPVMDGLEATRRVRAHPDPRVARVPIIAITALAMTGDRDRCLAAGANEYMSKPVGLKHLLETIRNLLPTK